MQRALICTFCIQTCPWARGEALTPNPPRATGGTRPQGSGGPTLPHSGGVGVSPSSLKDNGMFSAGLSAHVLICMNTSSGSIKNIFMRNKDKLSVQHYQTTWYLGQSLSSSSAQGTVCTLKSEIFYQMHAGHLCQYLTMSPGHWSQKISFGIIGIKHTA